MSDIDSLQALADATTASLEQQPADSGLSGEGLPSDAEATGQPATPPPLTAADLEALREELRGLKGQVETVDKRFGDTQKWGNEQNQGRIFAESLLQAKQKEEAERLRAEREAAQYQYPVLTAEQKEQLLADPEMMDQYIRAHSTVTARQILAYLQPQLEAGRAAASVIGPMLERQAGIAFQEARAASKQSGIEPAEFDSLAESADAFIQQASGGDWTRYNNMRTDPRAWRHAILMARDANGGAPVNPTPRAPSLGGGDRRPAPTPGSPGAPRMTDKQLKIARTFGLTKEDVEAYNQRQVAQRGR